MDHSPIDSTMNRQRVDPGTIGVWRWQALLSVLPLALVALFVSSIRLPGPVLLLLIVIAAIAVVLAWTLPSTHYQALDYAVDATGIEIRSGILWRSHVSLARARIQHTDVSQGPLQRRYGVATLKLYTAGSRYTRIDLPGLAHDEALSLRDELIARAGVGSGV